MWSYSSRTKGRWAFGLASLGVLWTAAMIPGAFYFPAYGGASPNSLVGVNGTWVVWLFVPPLVLSVIAWLGLHASCARGSRRGRKIGNAAAYVLLVAAFLMFSAGSLVLPAALFMVIAATQTPRAAGATE